MVVEKNFRSSAKVSFLHSTVSNKSFTNKFNSNGFRLDPFGTPILNDILKTERHFMKQSVTMQINKMFSTVGKINPNQKFGEFLRVYSGLVYTNP